MAEIFELSDRELDTVTGAGPTVGPTTLNIPQGLTTLPRGLVVANPCGCPINIYPPGWQQATLTGIPFVFQQSVPQFHSLQID